MKKFIRFKTGFFLTKEGETTNDLSKAWEIGDWSDATRAKEQFQLKGVEIYYSFYEETKSNQWDFWLPMY